jgi:exonuclease III
VLTPEPLPPKIQNPVAGSIEETSPQLPGFFLTNTRSAVNKIDELDVLLHQSDYHTDIAVLTETWQSDKIPDDFLAIDGFNLFTRTRTAKRGGGVAVYVKDQIPVTALSDIKVPDELECLWLWVRPHRLPRKVSGMVVCAVYIPLNLHIRSFWLITL